MIETWKNSSLRRDIPPCAISSLQGVHIARHTLWSDGLSCQNKSINHERMISSNKFRKW
ncbi:hypothetical protein M758_5G093300 [Ceratodon purpureus]|nr:hypothetical protein M758_5G093300 [Ceratodon purpureus]